MQAFRNLFNRPSFAPFLLAVLSIVALGLLLAIHARPAHADTARFTIFSKTYDAASTADGAAWSTTVGSPGAALGDVCLPSLGVDAAGITVTCYVSAANTATVRGQNESGGTVDLASTTLRVFIFPKGVR